LYVINENQIEFIQQQVKAILSRIGKIPIGFEVAAGFPDERSISLKCSDPSGK
jgi:hypothetical protein